MALSDERIDYLARNYGLDWVDYELFARAIEAEVRKSDEALIRKLVEALENSNATLWEEDDDPSRPAHAAITAGRARLEGKSCA